MTADEPRCRCGQQDVRSSKSDNADPPLPEYVGIWIADESKMSGE